ncbi:MucR family transcriptional regulator [Mesorhizobium sp. 131-2-5]|uniref:MucR family transcriptional regulator n=1 Tax=Mesorhizobium sp. 131-2-5 TaxID=2744519 RepID=UPI0019252F41|nr:MucR family transcriptional regulator [Mesorhizobium sp. 131-2-5]BCG98690.1 MucR family transcriptional regulator [Mesorhizobium sp. 131-2-5]
MNEQPEAQSVDLVELTAEIVSAYVSKNPLPVAGLPDLIASIHLSLAGIGQPPVPEAPRLEPAVNPKRSVFPDYIICLEDGKKFKSLKRHLGVHYGLTPDEYRAKWGLKSDYPMVAPNYAAQRSLLAKSSGLGRKTVAAPAKKSARRKV